MGHPEFNQSTVHAFLEFIEVVPVQIVPHVSVVATRDSAFRLNNRFDVIGKSIRVGTFILGKVMRHTRAQEQEGEK